MITRLIRSELLESASEYPVATVLGPRQSGKTTLARGTFPQKPYFSMEDPDVRMAAEADPRGFFAGFSDGAILDEIQRLPILLPYLQGIVDERQIPGQFILTGSHQPEVHQAISQSLAGRTAILTLLPFSLEELQAYNRKWEVFELIVAGGFPRLHENQLKPQRFFSSYLQTYIERDVRALIQLKDLTAFQQFLRLVAGRMGQLINHSSLANDVGVSSTTIKHWISALVASYVLFELPPFFDNIRKRVVKSSKLYFTDTGLCCHLLGIFTAEQASRDPLRGGLYENWVILEILKFWYNRGMRPELYFYRDSHGNEVDLVVRHATGLIPFEIKSGATFSNDFLKGIERFRDAAGPRVKGGAVLYNGERQFRIGEVECFNFLLHDKLESVLRAPEEV